MKSELQITNELVALSLLPALGVLLIRAEQGEPGITLLVKLGMCAPWLVSAGFWFFGGMLFLWLQRIRDAVDDAKLEMMERLQHLERNGLDVRPINKKPRPAELPKVLEQFKDVEPDAGNNDGTVPDWMK